MENSKISDKKLYDDVIIEVDHDGKEIFRWLASDHVKDMGFDTVLTKTVKTAQEVVDKRGGPQ